nr:zinc finger protein 569-like [Cherax quadricarinatus]
MADEEGISGVEKSLLSTRKMAELHQQPYYAYRNANSSSNVRMNSDSQMVGDKDITGAQKMFGTNKKTPKTYKCTHCSFFSTKRCNFVEHYRIHTGEKPFLCPQCSYRTGVMSNLRRHFRIIHAVERSQPYH